MAAVALFLPKSGSVPLALPQDQPYLLRCNSPGSSGGAFFGLFFCPDGEESSVGAVMSDFHGT